MELVLVFNNDGFGLSIPIDVLRDNATKLPFLKDYFIGFIYF